MGETSGIGQEFERQKAALPGGAAVAKLRTQGVEDFLVKGWPTAKTEGWRYADLKGLGARRLPPAAAKGAAANPATDWPFAALSGGKISLSGGLPGAALKSLGEALRENGTLGRDVFLPAAGDHPFDHLNRAFAGDGFVLGISEGAKVSGLEMALAFQGMKDGACHARNLVRVGAGATATLFLRTAVRENSGWLNAVTKIRIGEGAHLTLYGDFESGKDVFLSSLLQVAIARNGTFAYRPLAAGVASLRHEVHARLEGEGASLDLAGGLLAAGGETADVVTQVTHAAGRAVSRQRIRAIAGGKGRSAFQGRIVVEEGAVKTDARQECHNLLLGRDGEANVKPELLIFADDVACAHGATVGQVDAAALFYLTQRGIPEGEARAMLVRAFLSDVLDAASHEAVQAAFAAKVEGWMERHVGGKGRHE